MTENDKSNTCPSRLRKIIPVLTLTAIMLFYPIMTPAGALNTISAEEQRELWQKWQWQDKTMTDFVKELHTRYDNKTIQAIVSFEEHVPLPVFKELLSEYELELQHFNFKLTGNQGGIASNKRDDFSNITKIIEEDEKEKEEKLVGISRIVANGTARNYADLLVASITASSNVIIDEFHILRQIDENMLQGEELKQKLERAEQLLMELNETMREQIPWAIVSTSEENGYLAVGIDKDLATEPKAVYEERLKKLVGEDVPVVVSFNRVRFTTAVE